MKSEKHKHRAALAGTAARVGAAALPRLPAVAAAETLAPALQVDRAGFSNRLHQ